MFGISLHTSSLFKFTSAILVTLFVLSACSEKRERHVTETDLLFSFGSDGFDEGYDLAIDREGNIVVCGVFGGKGGFSFLKNDSSIKSNGGYDLFVVKYDKNGDFIWSITMGGVGWDELNAVKIAKDGRIYVCGFFNGVIGTAGRNSISSRGGNDAIVMCLSVDGEMIWMNSFGSRGDDEFNDLILDDDDNVWVAGLFSGPLFMNDSLPCDVAFAGNKDVLLVKLDQYGKLKKSIGIGSMREEVCGKFTSKNENILLGGGFYDSVKVGGYNIASKNQMDYFTLDFDKTGKTIAFYSDGGEGNQVINSTLGLNDQIIISGQEDKMKGVGSDAFIGSLNTENKLNWMINVSSKSNDWAKGLAYNKTANTIMAAVVFQDTVIVQDQTYISDGLYDILLFQIDLKGKIINAEQIGDVGEDGINILKTDSFNNLYSTGWFSDKPTFGKKGNEIESRKISDIFIYKKNLEQ